MAQQGLVESVEHPTFTARDFDLKHGQPGISAFMRVRNEEEFLEQSVNSILPYCDELALVYHQSTDRTPDIVTDLARRAPEKIKAYHYLPQVYWCGTKEFSECPVTLPHSVAYYSNFGLSRTTHRIWMKWDGDQVAVPDAVARVTAQLRALTPRQPAWWLSPQQWGYWTFSGVNLYAHKGQVCVLKAKPFIGHKGRDHGLWRANYWTRFKQDAQFEYPFTRFLRQKPMGILFYHLRGLKRDLGMSKFNFRENPNSPFRSQYPNARNLPDPATLGITPPRAAPSE